jgi:hypothetical protein
MRQVADYVPSLVASACPNFRFDVGGFLACHPGVDEQFQLIVGHSGDVADILG